MADFQPKFVDLVRSYTSTMGTGAFVLGPTVPGFAGFATALHPGDTFYYSAIGVDKPAEREVGRGTLMSNGTITRAPLSGSTTNFSSRTKSIALIAPAEWYNSVQAGVGSAPAMAATRGALAGQASHSAPAILSEAGREGLFLFDGSNQSAAVGADVWQGVYVAPASDPTGASGAWVRRFTGAVSPEWFGAIGDGTTDDREAIQAAIDHQARSGGGQVRLSAKKYYCGAALTWSGAAIELAGAGSGVQASGGTILSFPAGLSGAVIVKNGSAGLGAGSIVRNLRIKGSGVTAVSDANAALGVGCGLLLQANGARVEDVVVQGFEGNGAYILSGVSAPDVSINANNVVIDNIHCWDNLKNGLATLGVDSNHALIHALDCTNSGQFGVYENGFLGNTYLSPHFAGNASGPIRFGNMTGHNRVSSAYKEVGTALLVQFDSGGSGQNVVEFQTAAAAPGDEANFTVTDNSSSQDNDVTVLGVRRKARFGGDGANGTFVFTEDVLSVRKGKQIQLQDEPLTANWYVGNYGGAAGFSHPSGTYLLMTGDGPTVLGDNGVLSVTGAVMSTGAGAGVGYAAGAGGAVTQATSKSTGVTINKAAGRITMNAASLAAGALASFTVTNSVVAASDTITLNLASGNAAAGTYRYWVEGVAAGSFKIAVENRSAGALAEALVFNFAVLKGVSA